MLHIYIYIYIYDISRLRVNECDSQQKSLCNRSYDLQQCQRPAITEPLVTFTAINASHQHALISRLGAITTAVTENITGKQRAVLDPREHQWGERVYSGYCGIQSTVLKAN